MKTTLDVEQRKALRDFCVQVQEDGALRAALKRAPSITSIVVLEAVTTFEQRMVRTERERDQVARLAILLVHRCVKRSSSKDEQDPAREAGSLAERFGEMQKDRRVLNPLRFQRLIHGDNDDERLRQLRRALGLLPADSLHREHVAEAWLQLIDPQGRRAFARNYFAPTPSVESNDIPEVTP